VLGVVLGLVTCVGGRVGARGVCWGLMLGHMVNVGGWVGARVACWDRRHGRYLQYISTYPSYSTRSTYHNTDYSLR
jgi:hypothetical protein